MCPPPKAFGFRTTLGLRHYHFGKQKIDESHDESVGFMVQDGSYLYPYQNWVSGSGPLISRMPIAGGTLAPLAEGPQAASSSFDLQACLAVDDSSLFFYFHTDPVVLFALPKAGGAPAQIASAAEGSTLVGVGATGGYVYFLEWDADYSRTTLKRVAATGGQVDTLFQTDGECSHLAVDDGFVYVTNRDLGKVHKVER